MVLHSFNFKRRRVSDLRRMYGSRYDGLSGGRRTMPRLTSNNINIPALFRRIKSINACDFQNTYDFVCDGCSPRARIPHMHWYAVYAHDSQRYQLCIDCMAVGLTSLIQGVERTA